MSGQEYIQSIVPSRRSSVLCLVVSWVLVFPLMYFAGGFWFQNVRENNVLSEVYSSLVLSPRTLGMVLIESAVFTIACLLLFTRTRQIIFICRKNPVFVSLVALAIASCLWSQFPMRSLEFSLCLMVNTLFAFYLYARFSREQQMALFLMLGWICLVLSIILALFFPRYGLSASTAGAWRGIYVHKNRCSMMTIVFLSSAFYAPAITLLSKVLRMVYVALSVFLVMMAQSATGAISLVFLLGYVVAMKATKLFYLKERRLSIVLLASVALTSTVIGAFYLGDLTYILGRDPSLSGRTAIWAASMVSILKRPILGYGYMSFWMGYQGESANASLATGSSVPGAHNGFLEVWLTLGGLGLGLVVYAFASAFRNSLYCFRAGNSRYFIWCLCIVFLEIVTSIDESGTLVGPNMLFWILFILASVGLADGARHFRFESGRG
jgi:exopolysaccharide production protein ExoQ